jgi:hypothetical protein
LPEPDLARIVRRHSGRIPSFWSRGAPAFRGTMLLSIGV